MKYIFSGDLENVCLEMIDDADYTERRIAHLWSKAEFFQLTGILIPEYIELLAIEPDRDIFAVKYEDELVAEIFEQMQDAPQFMQDIWTNRQEIRMHFKAALQENRDEDNYYHYDVQLDQIIQTPDPMAPHNNAARELSRTKIGCRVIIDLVDLLIAKGIITQAELPEYYDTSVGNIKSIVDTIDWSKM